MTNELPKNYFEEKGKSAEEFVHDLATKSFLSDWCFLNPKLPSGKELCDLLVVFDDTAIIWQIKDLKLDEDMKYDKAEVEKNIRQLGGARRMLIDLRTPINLENPRRKVEKFDPSIIKRVFLISGLTGEGELTSSFEGEIKGHFVHIFTREFIQVAFNELDTISDFIEYLTKKEEYMKVAPKMIIIGGEEQLLGQYILGNRSFSNHGDIDCLLISEGIWEGFQCEPRYLARKEANEISYGGDDIINQCHRGGDGYEIIARELARPNRVERRLLAKAFVQAWEIAEAEKVHDIFRRTASFKNTTFCFLFASTKLDENARKNELINYCNVARLRFPENTKVVGICANMSMEQYVGYMFALILKCQGGAKNLKRKYLNTKVKVAY